MSCKVWLRLYFCEASSKGSATPRSARLRLEPTPDFFSPLYFLRPLMESSASGLAPPASAPPRRGEGLPVFFSPLYFLRP
jgi:hypothetical protein